jgi:hypothetical protein
MSALRIPGMNGCSHSRSDPNSATPTTLPAWREALSTPEGTSNGIVSPNVEAFVQRKPCAARAKSGVPTVRLTKCSGGRPATGPPLAYFELRFVCHRRLPDRRRGRNFNRVCENKGVHRHVWQPHNHVIGRRSLFPHAGANPRCSDRPCGEWSNSSMQNPLSARFLNPKHLPPLGLHTESPSLLLPEGFLVSRRCPEQSGAMPDLSGDYTQVPSARP